MTLAGKLQLKAEQRIAVVGAPDELELDDLTVAAHVGDSDALLAFVRTTSEAADRWASLRAAAEQDKLAWIAYPKAKQAGTDLNRDIVRSLAEQHGLKTVRQIAVDDTWSALRLRV